MLRKLIILSVLLLIGVGVAFFFVDQKVKRRLAGRSTSTTAAILADAFFIDSGRHIPPSILREELLRRGYSEAAEKPLSPGEFRFSEDAVSIITRPFLTPRGVLRPSVHSHYSLTSGKIEDSDGEPLQGLIINPYPVSQLGTGNFRMSQHKELSQIPDVVKKAVVSIEDERFFKHFGIDVWGILRAMAQNVRAMKLVQGGSTITQQLAKNLFFTPERTVTRKLLEMLAAISLELRLSKEEILEMYLNEVYLGQEGTIALHGIEAASYAYFGKSVERITLSEAAMLAGIIRAPSYYSPRRHSERARERRNVAIEKMLDDEVITPSAAKEALATIPSIEKERRYRRPAPYFVAAVERELEQYIPLSAAIPSGIQVYTGLDLAMQECAEDAVSSGVKELIRQRPFLKKKENQLQSALVAIEPHSGLIKAWVGGRDFGNNQFNRVNQSLRQLGSAIKPLVYLTTLDGNLNNYRVATARSLLPDRPTQIRLANGKIWEPENYDHEYHGDVTLRYAVEHSLNLPAVYVVQRVGVHALADTTRRFRLLENPPEVPSLALGSADASLLNVTAAYGALANGGIYVKPRLFVSVLDSGGDKILESEIVEEQVADPAPVFVVTNILQGVIERGTGNVIRRLGFTRPAAGKTGTSNEARDAWFVGYTPKVSVGVWVGLDNNEELALTGAGGAAPIWANFMKCAEPFVEPLDFIPPSGVEFVEIDRHSGDRASRECPPEAVQVEVFVRGTAPERPCSLHGESRDVVRRETHEIVEEEAFAPKRRRRSFWDVIFGEDN